MRGLHGATIILSAIFLATLEVGFFGLMPRPIYFIHPVLIVLLILFRERSTIQQVTFALTAGFILDVFSSEPFGRWLLGLLLSIVVTKFIFRHWLSHRFWLTPLSAIVIGWLIARPLANVLLGFNDFFSDHFFSRPEINFWFSDLMMTLGASFIAMAVYFVSANIFQRYVILRKHAAS